MISPVTMRGGISLSLLACCLFVQNAAAFYLPGVAPTDYQPGKTLNAKVSEHGCTDLGMGDWWEGRREHGLGRVGAAPAAKWA